MPMRARLSTQNPNTLGLRLTHKLQEITKVINKRIEEQTAAAAVHNGMRLSMVRGCLKIQHLRRAANHMDKLGRAQYIDKLG